jgi:ADP-heptose:LPS heptosyltransferase
MSTLVIQLGRLGDVIQTTPLLLQLAAQQPGQRLDLLVVEPNHQCVSGLPGLTSVYTVSEDLKPLDDQIASGFPRRQIPPAAWHCLRSLELPHYDHVINASHAALGCWLAGEISSTTREGGVINRRGECLYDGGAHAYRVAMIGFRRQNRFNIVDLLRCSGPPGVRHAIPKLHVDIAIARELPFVLPLSPTPKGSRIALNVGANEKHRCWPPQHFARLAAALHEFDCSPILVGAPSDRDACAEVEALSRFPLPNFAGQTSIPEMARLLKECDLLISSDTGAVHIAAAVGTTVLGLYGASAYFAETSPWGPGHLILQTALGAPLSDLTAELVLSAALNRLGRRNEADLRGELQRANQSAWATRLLPVAADGLGGVIYRPLHASSCSAEELFTQALRHSFAQLWTGRNDASKLDVASGDFGPASERDVAILAKETAHALEIAPSILHVLEQLCAAARECEALTGEATSESTARVNAIAAALERALETLSNVVKCEECAMFRPVVHYLDWRLRMTPLLPPAATFRYLADDCRAAARVLASVHTSIGTLTNSIQAGVM